MIFFRRDKIAVARSWHKEEGGLVLFLNLAAQGFQFGRGIMTPGTSLYLPTLFKRISAEVLVHASTITAV